MTVKGINQVRLILGNKIYAFLLIVFPIFFQLKYFIMNFVDPLGIYANVSLIQKSDFHDFLCVC